MNPAGRQFCRHVVHPFAAQAVDDTRLAGPFPEKLRELRKGLDLVQNRVADVGAIEAGDITPGLPEVEPVQDVLAGVGFGGRRQGDHRYFGEYLAQAAELAVFGPEIMAPLGDAVGLVDGEQGDRDILEALDEVLADQPFRGDVEEVQFSRMEQRQHPAGLAALQGGIVIGRLDAAGLERIDLVLHQGDEGRNDNPDTRAMEGGDLITERFAASRGHEDKGVLALDEPLDNLLLLGTIGIVAEDIFKAFQRLTGHEYKSQCSVIENTAFTACSIMPYTRKNRDRELLFLSNNKSNSSQRPNFRLAK